MPSFLPDEVDRAVAATRRGIGRLVDLLGSPDPAVRAGAAAALNDLGATAILEPLVLGLRRAAPPAQAEVIAAALRACIGVAPARVAAAVREALRGVRNREVHARLLAIGSAVAARDVVAMSRGGSAADGRRSPDGAPG